MSEPTTNAGRSAAILLDLSFNGPARVDDLAARLGMVPAEVGLHLTTALDRGEPGLSYERGVWTVRDVAPVEEEPPVVDRNQLGLFGRG